MDGGVRAAVVAGTLLVGLIVVAPGAQCAGRPGPDPHRPAGRTAGKVHIRATPTPSPPGGDGRLAGSAAGEGRTHPGRAESPESTEPAEASESPGDDAEGADTDQAPDASPSAVPSPHRRADAARRRPSVPPPPPPPDDGRERARREAMDYGDRVMRVLPLGTGMTLTGLGLAFFALRLRRTK
ncbi:hypothetical protein [Streptomyces sp. NPDC002537]